LTVWGPDETVTYSDIIQQVGTVDVSSLAGGSVIGGFEISCEAGGYPIQIAQLSYSIPPQCSDGYDNDGDDSGDYPADPDCSSPSSDNEAGTPLPPTQDFTQTGGGVFPDLDLGTVFIVGSDASGAPASLVLSDSSDEFGGVGVQGGADSDFIDGGESVSFDFAPGRASNVSYRMHQVSNTLPEELFTPYLLTIWDTDGATLYSQSIHRIATVDVSALVGNQPIGGFEVQSQAVGNSIRISQISYASESKQVETLQFRSIGLEDGVVRERKEENNVGNFSNSTRTSSGALRAGDHKRDNQWKSILSFETDTLPAGVEITRATLILTVGGFKGDPFTGLGNLVADVQTGGFGTSTDLEKLDFQASATAFEAGTLIVDPDFAIGDLDSTGIAAINRSGKTQVRLHYELDDNDNGDADYVGFYSGSNSNSNFHPVLEIEYEYWLP
jgi:hypothetical protein